MKQLAIPVFQERIAPVFDMARNLHIIEVYSQDYRFLKLEDGSSISRALRVLWLKELGIDVLICGGISRWLARSVETHGITMIPWIAGDVDQVIQAYMNGDLVNPFFRMPGCKGPGRHRNHGQRRSSGRGCCRG